MASKSSAIGLDHTDLSWVLGCRVPLMEAQSLPPPPRTRLMFDQSSRKWILMLGFLSVLLDEH